MHDPHDREAPAGEFSKRVLVVFVRQHDGFPEIRLGKRPCVGGALIRRLGQPARGEAQGVDALGQTDAVENQVLLFPDARERVGRLGALRLGDAAERCGRRGVLLR